MASICSVDGGGGCLSDREERFENSSDLASERGSSVGSHFGMFFGICALEDIGADGEVERLG